MPFSPLEPARAHSSATSTPGPDEYAPYYALYIEKARGADIRAALELEAESFPAFLRSLPVDKGSYRYQPGKWSLKEVVGHIIETERIMAYRALRISRGDNTPLPGFDQEAYMAQASYHQRDLDQLANEFEAVRRANLYLFRSLGETELLRKGLASEFPVSVRALLYIISGHLQHHWGILNERYL